MSDSAQEQRLEGLHRICRERGLVLTAQRRAVLHAVVALDNHPTADQVSAVLARRRPRVSRATVFRTLESLARLGVITRACHPGTGVRYDWRTEMHHHLVCLRCDAVIDISDARLDALPVPDTRRFGFVVSDLRVQLRGICRRCRELEERK